MDKRYTLIGIGELLWDEFPGSRTLGGAPANFAFHANRLGTQGIVVSRIGKDRSGQEILAELERRNIPNILSIDPFHPTGRVSVKIDSKGSPDYIIHENSSWDYLSIEPDMETIARQADVVCFGTLAQRNSIAAQAIRKFISITPENCLKFFDVNLRQAYFSKSIIKECLDLANILKLNHEELDLISKMFLSADRETTCLDDLSQHFNLDLIVLTKGKEGSRLFVDKNNDSVYKPERSQVIDTVGAGDSFSAAVAVGLLKKMPLNRINNIANTVASFVCSCEGATPIIPEKIVNLMN